MVSHDLKIHSAHRKAPCCECEAHFLKNKCVPFLFLHPHSTFQTRDLEAKTFRKCQRFVSEQSKMYYLTTHRSDGHYQTNHFNAYT